MNKSVIMRVLKTVWQYKLQLFASLFFAVINVASALLIPIFIGRAIDCAIGVGTVDFSALSMCIIKIVISFIIGALSQWLLAVFNNSIAYNCVRNLRKDIFHKIEKLDIAYLDGRPHGEILSLSAADTEQFSDGLIMGFSQLFTGVLTILGTLGIMLYYNWKIAVLVVLITPVSLFVAKFIASRTYSMFKKQSEIRAEQTGFINEMIGNLKVVHAFSHEDENVEKFSEINDDLAKSSLKATFFSSLTNPCTRFVNSLVYACVAAAGAFAVITTPTFTIGLLTSFLSYANQYTKPFNEISGVITELQNAFACAARIYEFIDLPNQSDDVQNIENIETNGRVDIENICFSYSPDRKLIENLTLNVKSGQRIAIVGPTGCGKTTLINLLMRFYDVDSGDILIDNRSIYSMPREQLRKKFGMVLQETWLRSGTIRDNICMGKPDATDDEIITASKAAHAHSFIKRLPDGYNTVIDEDGGNLSQGQKQLLCISRIMLSLPPMLILDEATSSIDTRTEQRIQEAFTTLTAGKTSFIVAHRLSTIKEADIILVMKDGNVIEQGSHDELLSADGFYATLYKSQFVHSS